MSNHKRGSSKRSSRRHHQAKRQRRKDKAPASEWSWGRAVY